MERQVIDLSEWAFLLINGPLIFFSLTANVFYVSCLISVSGGKQTLKQPLKTLLGCLVCGSIFYCVALPLLYYVLKVWPSTKVYVVSWAIVLFFIHNSLTSYVRLNFYFYTQIIPAQRALWIWAKRNIKSIMLASFLLDQMLFLINCIVSVTQDLPQNLTWTDVTIHTGYFENVGLYIFKAYILMCVCFTSISCISMTHYICRNMRNRALSSINMSRIQKHMRIAVSGICQVVLYFLFITFSLFCSFTDTFSPHFVIGFWVLFTSSSLYISGTTVNVGIGQAVFRQGAARTWKALKALCDVGVSASDGNPTSVETADVCMS